MRGALKMASLTFLSLIPCPMQVSVATLSRHTCRTSLQCCSQPQGAAFVLFGSRTPQRGLSNLYGRGGIGIVKKVCCFQKDLILISPRKVGRYMKESGNKN